MIHSVLYNAACNFALLGETNHALDGLDRAIEAGVAVGDWIKHDRMSIVFVIIDAFRRS